MPRTERDVAAPMVSVRNVSKTFSRKGASTQALRDVSLTVAGGEFVSLLGPSGCGKSTLLRIVGGLMEADRGQVEIAGEGPHHARERKQFGLVPQTPALLPWRTVRDNVHLLHQLNRKRQGHESLTDERINELLDTVGLGRFLDAYPHELSGGMQQRASLVRAFALGAPILLMDEPFAALDEITRADMRYLLLDLWERSRHHRDLRDPLHPRSGDPVRPRGRPGALVRAASRAEEPIALARPRHEAMEDSPEFHLHLARLRHALRESHAA